MADMNPLKKALESLQLECSDDVMEKFNSYMLGVLDWNEKVNLTTITDPQEFVVKHFIDSVICTDYPEYEDVARLCREHRLPFEQTFRSIAAECSKTEDVL